MDVCVHICKNGDVIFARAPISAPEFCEKCGEKMLDSCPSCHAKIMEWDFGGFPFLGNPDYERASYCRNCGKPYPWTEAAIEAASMLMEEDDELTAEIREKTIEVLPDIVRETPKTSLAVVRLKKAFVDAGKFTADGLRQFAIDFGCEFAKKQLGL